MNDKVKIIDLEEDVVADCKASSTPAKRRVAAYARVSTNHEEQALSFENQVNEWTRKINEKPEWEFVKIYSDKGKSGTTIRKRPGFQEMIADAHDGKIDLILVKSISRLGRDSVAVQQTVRDLRSIGVEIYFDEDSISSFDVKTDLVFSILASIAQEESRNISNHITWTLKNKMSNGIPLVCTSRFLGYDKNEAGDKLVINEAEAEIVKLIFNLYDSGMGCLKIAHELQKRGYKTVTGNSFWHTSAVLGILKNEKYVGDLLQQKKITVDYLTHTRRKNKKGLYLKEDAHDPIVSREQWNRVQEKLRSSLTNTMGENFDRSKYNNKYPLSGALVCLNCGKTYKRRTWNSKHATAKRYVYQCTHYVIKDEHGKSCHSKPVGEKVSHDICCDVINHVYLNKSKVFSKISSLIKSAVSTKNIDAEEKRIMKIKEGLSKKIDDLISERVKLDNQELKEKIDKQYKLLVDRYERTDAQLTNLNERHIASQKVKVRMQDVFDILGKNKMTPEMLTREIVDLFFYKIFVTADAELIFVIDATHTIKLDELVENREDIIESDPIYSGEMIDHYSRFKTIVRYKVVLV